MPFVATWIQLEIIILSKSERERQIPYITYMWNLKYDTNEPIYETNRTDRQNRLGGCQGGGVEWEVGISRCKLSYTE